MVKRFTHNEYYTLALVKTSEDSQPLTFCRNVTFKSRFKDLLYFTDSENNYDVDISTNTVILVDKYSQCTTEILHLANIVKGWQF